MHEENIYRLRQELGQAQLVVVSKYRTMDEILAVYRTGHRVFAENRVQALLERRDALPKDISWHLIGHLQTNKVRYIADFITCIQSVDSVKLLDEINRQALGCKRTIDCLLQVYIASEDTKFGLDFDECRAILESDPMHRWPAVRIKGLMGMATNTDDWTQVKNEFSALKNFYDASRSKYPELALDTLSMGMSSDYKIALECGSTLVRIGSKVFE